MEQSIWVEVHGFHRREYEIRQEKYYKENFLGNYYNRFYSSLKSFEKHQTFGAMVTEVFMKLTRRLN